MFFTSPKKLELPTVETALPGRSAEMPVPASHFVNKNPLKGPFPHGTEKIIFGLGCFWGAERIFWQTEGVFSTSVGYAAGITPNPTYEEVCSGRTGHNEVVLVVYHPLKVSFQTLLGKFWEGHNPTQGMRQGNDMGTQYRSGIYVYTDAQKAAAKRLAPPTKRNSRRPVIRKSQLKLWTRRYFSTPRITINSTWPRTQAVIAASAAQV